MDKISRTKHLLGKLAEAQTFPVTLAEGTVLHFPIHHRHATIGTIHRWSDGHDYQKTAAGWDLIVPNAPLPPKPVPAVDAPATADVAADLKGPETPGDHQFYDQFQKYLAGTGQFPAARKISSARMKELMAHAQAKSNVPELPSYSIPGIPQSPVDPVKATPPVQDKPSSSAAALMRDAGNPAYAVSFPHDAAGALDSAKTPYQFSARDSKGATVASPWLPTHGQGQEWFDAVQRQYPGAFFVKNGMATRSTATSKSADGKARVEFRNGLHAVMVPGGNGFVVSSEHKTAVSARDAAASWKPGEAQLAPKAEEPAHSGIMPAINQPGGLVAHGKWEKDLKADDEAEIRWTANHNHYVARGRVTKNNEGSARARLMHATGDYPIGHEITVPKMTSALSAPMNTKWAQSNGIFPVTAKTPQSDTAAFRAHNDTVAANGGVEKFKAGDEVTLHLPVSKDQTGLGWSTNGPERHVIRRVDKARGRIETTPLVQAPGRYGRNIDLAAFGHPIEKHAATRVNAGYVKTKDEPMHRGNIPDKYTHMTVSDDGLETGKDSRHTSEQSAREAAHVHNTYHRASALQVHVRPIAAADAPAPASAVTLSHKVTALHVPTQGHYETSLDSSGTNPVDHYDTKRARPHGAHHSATHAAVDSHTGKVLSTHAGSLGGNAGAQGAARGHMRDSYTHRPNGNRAHVETLAPESAGEKDAREAAHAKISADHEAKAAAYHASPEGNWIKSGEQLAPVIEPKPAHVSQEMHDAVVRFAHHVADKNAKELIRQGLVGKVHVANYTPQVKYKRGYAHVNNGGSGKYMVALEKPTAASVSHIEPGDVHGIKAYGVIHTGKQHGNVLKGDIKNINRY